MARITSLMRVVHTLGWREVVLAAGINRFMQSTMRGFYTTRALLALVNLGLFERLLQQRAVDVPAFAQEHALEGPLLLALCDYLYARGILQRQGSAYALDQRHRAVRAALQGPFASVIAYQDVFHNLEALVRGEKVYGRDIRREEGLVARGSGAAGRLLAFPLVAEAVRRRGIRRLLDLGCGDATFLTDLCARRPDVRAWGVDIAPAAIAAGQDRVAQGGQAGRITLLVGDILHPAAVAQDIGAIDGASAVYVLHEFHSRGEGLLVRLLDQFRTTFPGVPLIVCEVMRQTAEELRRRPGGVMEIQLWHDLSRQTLLTREEWRQAFRAAGFTRVEEDYVDIARTAIFTVR